MAKAGRKPNVALDDSMTREQIASELEKIVFTAAHDWQRAVSIDRGVRDLLVERLRYPFGSRAKQAESW